MTRRLAVAACLIVTAASCGDDGGGSEPDGGEPEEVESPGEPTSGDPLQVETDLGPVQGTSSEVEGVRAFRTIPYAAPPLDDDRWRPPRPAEPWDGVLDATEPGAACPQPDTGTSAVLVTPDWDPDCLTLNVWSPEDAADLPVMVWIHGGGFTTGSAHEPYYIGDNLASQDVMVVSMNYRLGVHGFLATEELAGESDDGSFGNYGLADQTAALEWVQRNAEAFGGDPDNVTIFGESAGGFAICGHLASPASDGLFDRAIIQSGGGCDRLKSAQSAMDAGAALMDDLGCDDIACLRELPDEDLIDVEFDSTLVTDDVRLSTTAFEQAESDELDGVPIIIGSNHDEQTLFTLMGGNEELTDDELLDRASELSDDPEAVVGLYPAADYQDNLSRYQTMATDILWTCPTLEFASVAGDTFVYHYTYVSEDNPLDLGATHGVELIPLFGHPEGIEAVDVELDEAGLEVSAAMQAAWTGFATDSDPGDEWSPYVDGRRVTLLDNPVELVDEIRDGRCDDLEPLTDVER